MEKTWIYVPHGLIELGSSAAESSEQASSGHARRDDQVALNPHATCPGHGTGSEPHRPDTASDTLDLRFLQLTQGRNNHRPLFGCSHHRWPGRAKPIAHGPGSGAKCSPSRGLRTPGPVCDAHPLWIPRSHAQGARRSRSPTGHPTSIRASASTSTMSIHPPNALTRATRRACAGSLP